MNVAESWTGPGGHVLHQPWFHTGIRDRFAELIAELEGAAPEGLADRRRAFRGQGQVEQHGSGLSAENQAEQATASLLELRAELLIGLRLVRAGVLRRMSDGTPDFECEYKGHGFGVEVTTRACDDIAGALHQCLERKLEAGPVTLMRQGDPVFHLSPEKVDEITDKIVASIAALSASAPDGHILGNVFIEEAGLNAVFMPGEDTMPGMRATFQPPLTGAEWDRHWKMAALLTRDRIQAKGRKAYALPSIVVMDVSRLGEAGRWPLGAWAGEFQKVVDACDLGNLQGVLVIRSTLDSMHVEPIAWRGGTIPAAIAAGAVLLGGDLG